MVLRLLAALAAFSVPCVHSGVPSLAIPLADLGLVETSGFVSTYAVRNFCLGEEGYVELCEYKGRRGACGDAEGGQWTPLRDGFECNNDSQSCECRGTLSVTSLESGSHAIGLRLAYFNGTVRSSKIMHIEKVPSKWPDEHNSIGKRSLTRVRECKLPLASGVWEDRAEAIRVTLVGTVEGMDGQKAIWLTQIAAAKRTRFTFVSYRKRPPSDTPFMKMLAAHGTKIIFSPLPSMRAPGIEGDVIDALVPGLSAAAAIKRQRERNGFDTSCADCCKKLDGQILDMMTPSWGRELVRAVVWPLQHAQVVVFGNSRLSSDALLVQAANFVGASGSIIDLVNLHPSLTRGMNPDVIVAPSIFAALHPSILALSSRSTFTGCTTVIHPGIDAEHFSPSRRNLEWLRRRTHINSPETKFIIGFVARLEPEKSPGLFIRMAALLTDCRSCSFVMIGAGALREPLEDLARLLNVQIHFTGIVDRSAELGEAYGSMNVLINPSLRSSETFCIVNVEAMSSGTPVISFGAGGVRDYLCDGETGILVDIATPDGLAAGVRRYLLMAKEDQSTLSKGSRERILRPGQELTGEKMAQRYESVYESVAARSRYVFR